jgi:hypothetical protein
MIGVVDLAPAPSFHLFQRRPGIVEPALVVPEDPSVRIRHPGQLRDRIGEQVKARFAFAQRGFRAKPPVEIALIVCVRHDIDPHTKAVMSVAVRA